MQNDYCHENGAGALNGGDVADHRAGVATNVCVESTLRDGFMLDFYTILVSDCTAAGSKTAYEATLENVRRGFGWVIDSNEICSDLKTSISLSS
jgi:nicotinamidase-related amidase